MDAYGAATGRLYGDADRVSNERPREADRPRVPCVATGGPLRITGEDCFIVKIHFPAMDQLDRILDRFLAYGTTTTSIVQSSPVPLRGLPLPEA